MCGRFVSREQAAIEREYNIRVRNPFERVYNAAPTMLLPVIRTSARADGAADREQGAPAGREALSMRWGLIPPWWSQPAAPMSTINARSEEAAAKPMWRSAVRHSRCLVPTLGWYEWQVRPEGKVPHFIHAPGLAGFCFAGLWSEWKNPAGEVQLSFAILTRAAAATLEPVHDRMPVVLATESWADWLSDWPRDHAARLAEHVANSLNEFEYYPVSRYVNAPRNQGERCIERVAA
ncbi:MAG: SOS response-associated peptidase [Gammaproteobacteria bacterium]|nr:SOS response-associated peptidase [Gammaproteobacteria bacterium]MDE2252350.1 SOS response-associated peptidase [Gammaproteobacteria bacterium]